MSLRIGVLGEPVVGGIPTHALLAGIPTEGGLSIGEEVRDREGRIWRRFDPAPNEEALDSLDQCHALVVFPPKEMVEEGSARDLLSQDLWALRKHRGKNAFTAGLPVLVIRDCSQDLIVSDPRTIKNSKATKNFSRGFGGIKLLEEIPRKSTSNLMEAFAGISKRAAEVAADYQRKSWWAGIRLWLVVFLLASFTLCLLGSAIFLALNPEIQSVLQYRQLKHGLSESNPFLLRAEKIEILEDRLVAVDGFLEQNHGISQAQRVILAGCRERLHFFIRKIRESQDWPKPEDIHDLPTLRQVVESVGNWNPGVPLNSQFPLVVDAQRKMLELDQALSGSESLLLLLDEKRNQGERLLKSNPETLASLSQWFTEVEKFSGELLQIRQKSKLLPLDEIDAAWDACLSVQGKVQDISRLVNGLGLLTAIPGTPAQLIPKGGPFEKEVAHASAKALEWNRIWERGEKGFGGDPRLMAKIRERARRAYEEWFQLGLTRLERETNELGKNRSLLKKWVLKKSAEPEWQGWGDLVWKMEALAHADQSEMDTYRDRNPWTESAVYLRKKEFQISPSKVEIQGPPGFFGNNYSDWRLVLKTGQTGEGLVFQGEKIEIKEKVAVLKMESVWAKSMVWDWSLPLQASLQNKSRPDGGREWLAPTPLEMGAIHGNGDLIITWIPDGAIPQVPRLLARLAQPRP